MAQECGFFNAELQGSEYDRVYNAEQFAAYFASFIGNGVFGNSMGELVVLENQQANMSVDVSSGQAWINGWWYRNTEELNLPIALADGVLNRKDIVVLRWGNAERDMWLQVLQGEPSGEPIAPEIVRNADYYDLKLCEISIPAGTSRITQSLITDTRLDNNVCGLVTGVVQQIDTTELYLQFRSQFEDFKDMSEEEFNEWFDAIKGQISTDLGIRLQLEIGDLSELETENKDDLVSAINEAASKGGTPGVFYNTDADAEADIANIPEGSMVYTNDGEDEPINARNVRYDDGTQAGSDVETQIAQINAEIGGEITVFSATPSSSGQSVQYVNIPNLSTYKKLRVYTAGTGSTTNDQKGAILALEFDLTVNNYSAISVGQIIQFNYEASPVNLYCRNFWVDMANSRVRILGGKIINLGTGTGTNNDDIAQIVKITVM